MYFTTLKKLVVPEGVIKKLEIGGKAVWQAETNNPFADIRADNFSKFPVSYSWTFNNVPCTCLNENNATVSDTYSGTMRAADHNYYLNTGDVRRQSSRHALVKAMY